MSEICGMSTQTFPFDETGNNPNFLGPCGLSPNHEGDHESPQFLEDKWINNVKWSDNIVVDAFLVPNVSDTLAKDKPKQYVESDYDKVYNRRINRADALEQAVKTTHASTFDVRGTTRTSDAVLEIAERYFAWLQEENPNV